MKLETPTPNPLAALLNPRIALACCGAAEASTQRLTHSTLAPPEPKRRKQSSPLNELVRAELVTKPAAQRQQELALWLLLAVVSGGALLYGLSQAAEFVERFPFFIRFVGASL